MARQMRALPAYQLSHAGAGKVDQPPHHGHSSRASGPAQGLVGEVSLTTAPAGSRYAVMVVMIVTPFRGRRVVRGLVGWGG